MPPPPTPSHVIPSPHHPPRPPLPSLGAHHPPSPLPAWPGPRGWCLRCTHPPQPVAPQSCCQQQTPPGPLPITSRSQRGQLLQSIRPRLTHYKHQEVRNQEHQELHAGAWGWGGPDPHGSGVRNRERRATLQQPWHWGKLGCALLRACVCLCVCVCVWLQDLILFRTPDRHRWSARTKA